MGKLECVERGVAEAAAIILLSDLFRAMGRSVWDIAKEGLPQRLPWYDSPVIRPSTKPWNCKVTFLCAG